VAERPGRHPTAAVKDLEMRVPGRSANSSIRPVSEKGHEAVAKLLLEKSAELETKSTRRWFRLIGWPPAVARL
jgi:hypothetical protein